MANIDSTGATPTTSGGDLTHQYVLVSRVELEAMKEVLDEIGAISDSMEDINFGSTSEDISPITKRAATEGMRLKVTNEIARETHHG